MSQSIQSSVTSKRDYSLTGTETVRAQERGLASAEWYVTPIPRKRMKELMQRRDGPAIRDTLIWFAMFIVLGTLAYYSWGTWWAIPAFLAYGTFYCNTGDSRWHEAGHGTAFKTSWMNEFVYQIASFLVLRPATKWRWSHTRHHTDTYIVGLDPEIAQPRPPVWRVILMEYFHLAVGPMDIVRIFRMAFGSLSDEEKSYIPASEHRRTFWESRVYVLIFAAIIAACLYFGSILPAMFLVLPAFYGPWLMLSFGLCQHLGLHEDVLDHRLNTRTIYMNPVFRFLYWNMNYHIEHHMFPMVPYHALPKLHEEMKGDMPEPCKSTWEAYKEVISALRKQRHDPNYVIERKLPITAQPYYYFTTGGGDNDESVRRVD
ncbi:fatty acid desaturase family protein [Paenibacillus sp. YIM B09110]|uniref:fatty acid desaturase family protein n=1 Tax=Paenibacillus sp. YIM B09110 TaxID=3126102 RepID=UPI00301D554D